MRILVIIPAYNEEESIVEVVENLKYAKVQLDYVIINDCSTDSTKKKCELNAYNFIDLPVNLGIGGGVQTGYLYATENDYDIAIQMDGDGQHDPKSIPDLIKPIIANECDLVIGSRFLENDGFQSSALRRAGITFLKWLIRICCGVKINDTTSGFRATSKKLTKHFAFEYAQDYPEPEAIIAAVLNGYRVCEVPVIMHERQGGESSINALKSFYYMAKVSMAILIYRIGFFKYWGNKQQ